MQNIDEIKNTYYEYISKIADGCSHIAGAIRNDRIHEGISSLLDLVEGLAWLTTVEEHLSEQGYTNNSRLQEANDYLNEINEGLEIKDYTLVADIFEYELVPLFSSASEWIFSKE